MNKLTKDYWYKFKNDGKLFEKLVDELLRAMFPRATFTHTTWSHDGGKDFVYGFPFFDEELKIWAECKFHKKALPIHDVSMTLFMAYIEAASTIIFFSYSPINSNFQKYIDLYKKKSNKQIKIYADISLENLILKYKDQIHFEDFFDISQDFTITNVFSPEIYKYWLHTDRKINKKYYTFHLNDVIKLEFSVFNQTSKPLTLSIEMKNNNDFLFFEVLDTTFVKNGYKETIEIPPNGVNGKTLLLKIKRYQPFLKLPFLIVDNGIKKRTLRISKSIFCRWLAETTIKGKKYKNLIKGAEELLALDRKSILCIVGRSGTGKSRVIKEIATTAVSMNYTYINVDADISRRLTADSFFKNIVAHFEDLPEISHLSKKQIKYLGDNSEQIDQIALDILFKRDIDYKAIHDELVCYLKKIFLKEHIFLCLENIQFYDESL